MKNDLLTEMFGGNRRALARVLTAIENDSAERGEYLSAIFPKTGKAAVTGITGPPGAGKSTLVDRIAVALSEQGKKVAILAVDPSSPFTGGAILGDRIRMSRASEVGEIFIRSMASRGALGGLAPRTAECIFALDAAGFDEILIETVGVGQGEVEIVKNGDTVVVVLVPGLGDGVQALKARILEIADVYAINKADFEGADRLERELITMMSFDDPARCAPRQIVRTVATKPEGIRELIDAILLHRKNSIESGARERRRGDFLMDTFLRDAGDELKKRFEDFIDGVGDHDIRAALSARSEDPQTLARKYVERMVVR